MKPQSFKDAIRRFRFEESETPAPPAPAPTPEAPKVPHIKEMKTVCAWCGKHLKGPINADRISHGMCPACFEKELPKKVGR
jgi:hypothetical protein